MPNDEKYAGDTHNHYMFERMCPKCTCFVCGREPLDCRVCLIKDAKKYKEWFTKEVQDNDGI